MATISFRPATRVLVPIAMIATAFAAGPVLAIPVVNEVNTDFSTKAVTFSFGSSSVTLSGTGIFSYPTAVQTAGGGEVSATTLFDVAPSSNFYPGRGGAIYCLVVKSSGVFLS